MIFDVFCKLQNLEPIILFDGVRNVTGSDGYNSVVIAPIDIVKVDVSVGTSYRDETITLTMLRGEGAMGTPLVYGNMLKYYMKAIFQSDGLVGIGSWSQQYSFYVYKVVGYR